MGVSNPSTQFLQLFPLPSLLLGHSDLMVYGVYINGSQGSAVIGIMSLHK